MHRADARAVVNRCLIEVDIQHSDLLGGHEHLVRDLRVSGDDLSYVFIPMVQKLTGMQGTCDDWKRTGTIDQVVDLIVRYTSDQGFPPK